jgi:TolB-like protein
MEGTVRRSGEQLCLSVRLINAADGFTVWSSVYERRIEGIFAVRDEVAQAVISALGPRLGAATGQLGRPRSTRND